ncbi:MAG TPA: thioesterase family protein, partial [Bacteroidota bacterium]|nr:thioesterase family protein [Bacteroidota bacterium]
ESPAHVVAALNKMGVVYNGTYFRFFEIGRTELMRYYGLVYSELEKYGYQLPLLEAHANYRAGAHYDDLLDIETTLDLDNIGPRVRFDYKILRSNILISDGWTSHIFFNIVNQKAVKPPRVFMEKIEELRHNL